MGKESSGKIHYLQATSGTLDTGHVDVGNGGDWGRSGCDIDGPVEPPNRVYQMKTSEKIAVHVFAAICAFCTLFAIIWFFVPFEPVVKWTKSEFIPPVARAGETVNVFREFEYTRPVRIVVERRFIKDDGTSFAVVDLPPVYQYYDKAAAYKQYRQVTLPCSLTEGKWELRNVVSYEDEIGRQQSVKSPVVPITITGGCE